MTDDELMSQPIKGGALDLKRRSMISKSSFNFPLSVGELETIYTIYIKYYQQASGK